MDKDKLTNFLPRTRCTEKELNTVKAKALKAGLSMSEYQRRSCCDSAVIIRESIFDKKAVKQLLAIGNNLNQITHKMHMYNDLDKDELTLILTKLDKLIMGIL